MSECLQMIMMRWGSLLMQIMMLMRWEGDSGTKIREANHTVSTIMMIHAQRNPGEMARKLTLKCSS